MKTSTKSYSDFFNRRPAAVAMIAPILLGLCGWHIARRPGAGRPYRVRPTE